MPCSPHALTRLRPWSLFGGELVPRQADLPALGALTAPGLVGEQDGPRVRQGAGLTSLPRSQGAPWLRPVRSATFSATTSAPCTARTTPLSPLCPAPTFGADDRCWPWAAQAGGPRGLRWVSGEAGHFWGESLGLGGIGQGRVSVGAWGTCLGDAGQGAVSTTTCPRPGGGNPGNPQRGARGADL